MIPMSDKQNTILFIIMVVVGMIVLIIDFIKN